MFQTATGMTRRAGIATAIDMIKRSLRSILCDYQKKGVDMYCQQDSESGRNVWTTPWGIQLIEPRIWSQYWGWRYDEDVEQYDEYKYFTPTCTDYDAVNILHQLESDPNVILVKPFLVKQLEARVGLPMKLIQKPGMIGVWILITEDWIVTIDYLNEISNKKDRFEIRKRSEFKIEFPPGPKNNIYDGEQSFVSNVRDFIPSTIDCKHTQCTTCERCSKCHPEFCFQLRRCSLCLKAAYCDVACQKMDWGRHKQGHCLILPCLLDMLKVFLLTELASIVLEYSQARISGFQTRALDVNTDTAHSLLLSENDGGFAILFQNEKKRRQRYIQQYDKVSLQRLWTWKPKIREYPSAMASYTQTIFAIQSRWVNMIDAKSGELQQRSQLPKHDNETDWNVGTCVASRDRLYLKERYDTKLWIFHSTPVQTQDKSEMQLLKSINIDGSGFSNDLILYQGQLLIFVNQWHLNRFQTRILQMDAKSLVTCHNMDTLLPPDDTCLCCIGGRLFIQQSDEMKVFCLRTKKQFPSISIPFSELGIASTSSYELVIRTKDGFSFLS